MSGSLSGTRPQLQADFAALRDRAASQLGFTIVVADQGGLRSHATQLALYNDSLAQGGGSSLAYPVATPGKSRHEYGAAFDVDIVAGGSSSDGAGTDADYQQLAQLGAAIGLQPGYYFAHSDPYHFQLDETLQQSIDAWNAMPRSRAGKIALGVLAVAAIAWAVTR